MNEFRILNVIYPDVKDVNYSILTDLLNDVEVQNGIDDRNLIIKYQKGNKFKIELIGYDGEVKNTFDKVNEDFFEIIFGLIDNMPIGSIEKDERDSSIEENNITKEDYLRAKQKYLNLKKKIMML